MSCYNQCKECKHGRDWLGKLTDDSCNVRLSVTFGNDTSKCSLFMKKEYTGLKYDDGKDRWDLLPLYLIKGIVETLTYGAKKYKANSWQDVENGYDRYKAAFMRHMVSMESGEWCDEESGLPHVYHMMTNAMFMAYFKIKEHK